MARRDGPRTEATDAEAKELKQFGIGAVFGLIGGVVGLVLPISVNFLAIYTAVGLSGLDPLLVSFTSLFVLVGAVFLAISLVFYQWAFRDLRKFDRSFYAASLLCLVGSVGFVLIIASMGITLLTTPSIVLCVQSTPSLAYTCLEAAPPLTVYSVVIGFWLAWCGGLGIVVGLELCGRRYREVRLITGGAVYALLLLVLIDPFVALFFPTGGWQYPVLTVPLLALLAPSLVYGSSYVQKTIPPESLIRSLPRELRARIRRPVLRTPILRKVASLPRPQVASPAQVSEIRAPPLTGEKA